MNTRIIATVLFALAANLGALSPVHAQGSGPNEGKTMLQKPKLGFRVGSANEGGSASLFLETQPLPRFAFRAGLESTGGSENYGNWEDRDEAWGTAKIDRQGIFADAIFSVPAFKDKGSKFFAFAGLGLYNVKVWDTYYYDPIAKKSSRLNETSMAPAVSAGLGAYFSRFVGMELKLTHAFVNSPLHDGTGREWFSLSLVFRIPLYRMEK